MRPFYLVFIALGLLLALVSCTVMEGSDLQSPGALLEQEDLSQTDLSKREPRSANGDIRELRHGGGSRGGGGGGRRGGSSKSGKKKKHGKHEKKTHGRGRG